MSRTWIRWALVLALVCAEGGSAARASEVDYVRDIEPIMRATCVRCHTDRGAAPFALDTYERVRARGAQIARVTASGFMPPWQASRQEEPLRFVGEMHITRDEIVRIAQWVEAGMPQGELIQRESGNIPATHPVAVATQPATAAAASQPGSESNILTLRLGRMIEVPAEGADVLYTFVLPTGLVQDAWVKRVEFVPSNPRLVHHASMLADATGMARQLAANSSTSSFLGMGSIGLNASGSYGTWTAGEVKQELSRPLARKLAKGADMVTEIHFAPTGKVEPFTFEVRLTLCGPGDGDANAEGAFMPVTTFTMGSYIVDIPAGERGSVVEDVFVLPRTVRLVSLTPHAHYVAQKVEVNAVLPNGVATELLRIEDWDFNWLREYQFVTPVGLPKQTKLVMRYTYDNSAENLQNPFDPPVRIRAGHRVEDEMAMLLVTVGVGDEEEAGVIEQAHREAVGRRIEEKKKAEVKE